MSAPGGICLGSAWSQGVSVPGGLPGLEGGLVPGGLPGAGGSAPGRFAPGGCLVETPPTATAAGGTHPTGMHSSYIICIALKRSSKLKCDYFTLC